SVGVLPEAFPPTEKCLSIPGKWFISPSSVLVCPWALRYQTLRFPLLVFDEGGFVEHEHLVEVFRLGQGAEHHGSRAGIGPEPVPKAVVFLRNRDDELRVRRALVSADVVLVDARINLSLFPDRRGLIVFTEQDFCKVVMDSPRRGRIQVARHDDDHFVIWIDGKGQSSAWSIAAVHDELVPGLIKDEPAISVVAFYGCHRTLP